MVTKNQLCLERSRAFCAREILPQDDRGARLPLAQAGGRTAGPRRAPCDALHVSRLDWTAAHRDHEAATEPLSRAAFATGSGNSQLVFWVNPQSLVCSRFSGWAAIQGTECHEGRALPQGREQGRERVASSSQ